MKFRLVLSAILGFSALAVTGSQAATVDASAPGDLLRAAASGNVTLLKSALKRGAPLEIRDGQYLVTPLGWAAWKGNLEAVDALLATGANTEAHSTGGQPIPVTLKFPIIGSMTGPESSDQTPLTLSIIADLPQSTSIVHTLLKHGANPNTQNATGDTPFLYATLFSKAPVIDDLLAHGADPNLRGTNGFFSPLVGAVVHISGEDSGLVKKLLDAGANPNDHFIKSPITYFARLIKRTSSAELIEAAQTHKIEEQKRIAAQPAIIHPDSSDEPTFVE